MSYPVSWQASEHCAGGMMQHACTHIPSLPQPSGPRALLVRAKLLHVPLHCCCCAHVQGLTFACGWSAACVLCMELAPTGLAATLQGLMASTYYGVGCGLGSLLGGLLLQAQLGWAGTWAISAGVVGVLWGAAHALATGGASYRQL